NGEESRTVATKFQSLGGTVESCGRITTVSCLQDNALLKAIRGEPNPGGVLGIAGQEPLHTALVGDIIAGLGQKNGWAGVIVNAAIRDSKAIGEMDFGCKALGANPRKSTKTGAGAPGVVLRIGGVAVNPGEYVYADSDGIIVTKSPVDPQ